MPARLLGHSMTVAEKHYLGVVRGIPREARTLEAAMQIEDVTRQVVEAAGEARPAAESKPSRNRSLWASR